MTHIVPCKDGTLRVAIRAADVRYLDPVIETMAWYRTCSTATTCEEAKRRILRTFRRDIEARRLTVDFL